MNVLLRLGSEKKILTISSLAEAFVEFHTTVLKSFDLPPQTQLRFKTGFPPHVLPALSSETAHYTLTDLGIRNKDLLIIEILSHEKISLSDTWQGHEPVELAQNTPVNPTFTLGANNTSIPSTTNAIASTNLFDDAHKKRKTHPLLTTHVGVGTLPITNQENSPALSSSALSSSPSSSSSSASSSFLRLSSPSTGMTRSPLPHPSATSFSVNFLKYVNEIRPTLQETLQATLLPSSQIGKIKQHSVLSDNNCLFTSIAFLLWLPFPPCLLRHVVSIIISTKQDAYPDAFFEQPRAEYAEWILKDKSWGGMMEIAILADFFNIPITIFDIETCRKECYGKKARRNMRNEMMGEKGEERKRETMKMEEEKEKNAQDNLKVNATTSSSCSYGIFLLYDGIHYDPLLAEHKTVSNITTTVFALEDHLSEQKALAYAKELNQQHHFTNVHKFLLQCELCGQTLQGQTAAVEHARQTGHQQIRQI